jgi:hypothetical protein
LADCTEGHNCFGEPAMISLLKAQNLFVDKKQFNIEHPTSNIEHPMAVV